MVSSYDETIMVVDDDDNVREVMRQTLELEGYRVLAARNGADALDVAAEYAMRIHLIVTDVRMPQMGGAQLIEVVRRWYPSLRCLIVSGYADFSDSLEVFDGTPTAFLHKPFSVEQLAAAVRELLDRPTRPTRVGTNGGGSADRLTAGSRGGAEVAEKSTTTSQREVFLLVRCFSILCVLRVLRGSA